MMKCVKCGKKNDQAGTWDTCSLCTGRAIEYLLGRRELPLEERRKQAREYLKRLVQAGITFYQVAPVGQQQQIQPVNLDAAVEVAADVQQVETGEVSVLWQDLRYG